MKLLDSADVYGYTFFCDDIRQEVGQKFSLVGAYPGRMIVHGAFPCLLPKFAVFVTCVQRVRSYIPIKKFHIYLPDTSEDGEPSYYLDSMPIEIPPEPNNEHAIAMGTALTVLAPVVLAMPGMIKVRAERAGELVRCGALTVEQALYIPDEIASQDKTE